MTRKDGKQKKAGGNKTTAETAKPVQAPSAFWAAINKLYPLTCYLFLAATVMLVVMCRIRLLDVPLERDEGEYAYVGQQLLHGVPPFVSIYHFKLPGIYAAYALVELIFGQTSTGIHLGLLFINLLTAFVLFLIVKRLFDVATACFATASFMLLALSISFYGFTANAEHFVLLFALPGILLMLSALSNQASGKNAKAFLFFALSGLLLGISYVMKQHGLFFTGFAALFMLYKLAATKPVRWKDLLLSMFLFATGAIIPISITCLIFLKLGLFEKFWWWTFVYSRIYAAGPSLAYGWQSLVDSLCGGYAGLSVFGLLALLALVGLIGVAVNKDGDKKVFAVGLAVLSFAAVCVGLNFFPHYYLLFLPALGLLTALGADTLTGFATRLKWRAPKYAGLVTMLIVFAAGIYNQRDYLFTQSAMGVMRNTYGPNPFPEAVELGKYIEANTKPGDKIAVIGSEPEIYFYANRRAATGYVYVYEMMREQPFAGKMQKEMLKEVEQNKPKYILFVNQPVSWSNVPNDHPDYTLRDSSLQYANQNYQIEGFADIVWPGPLETHLYIDAPEKLHLKQAGDMIVIFKRKVD